MKNLGVNKKRLMCKKYEKMNAIELFFYYLDMKRNKLIDIIESYFTRNGIAIDECISYAFAEEFEKLEEGYFGENGIVIVIQEPVADKEKEEVYSLKEFFSAVDQYYQDNLDYYQNENIEIMKSELEKIKDRLNI